MSALRVRCVFFVALFGHKFIRFLAKGFICFLNPNYPHPGCHHGNDETFLVGNPNKPSFVTITNSKKP